jgi:hypothetical protein
LGFPAEKVPRQRPYFLFGYGFSTVNEVHCSTQSDGNTQLAPNTWRIYSTIFTMHRLVLKGTDKMDNFYKGLLKIISIFFVLADSFQKFVVFAVLSIGACNILACLYEFIS